MRKRRPYPRKVKPLRERFEAKVERTDGCWLWKGTATKGYGRMNFDNTGRKIPAHRASYLIYVGEIAPGMLVCHKCDNPLCVNPDHLFLGTAKENNEDMFRKGRARRQDGENNPFSKLTWEDVRKIRADTRMRKFIAADYNVRITHVDKIRRGEIWREN